MRYELNYWPCPFRGNFARVILAYVNEEWREPNDHDEMLSLKELPPSEQPIPFMGPPLLVDRKGGIALAQTAAIVSYLGETHGVSGDSPARRGLALKSMCDATDVLAELTRSNGAQMWDRKAWTAFRNNRLPQWLAIFETTGRAFDLGESTGTLLGTAKYTTADLVTYALWATMERCLPQLSETLREHAPFVMALCDRVGSEKTIAKLVAAQERSWGDLYCGGMIERSIREQLVNDTSRER